jgi:tetratricopeptide (TPR) repeat protein
VLEAQGNLRDAVGHYRTSFEIKNARLQRDPSDVAARAELARAVNKLGRVQQALGDLTGARTQFENEVATYRVLVQTDPQQTQWKQRLGASLSFLAAVRSYTGDLFGASACAEEALSIDGELAARDADNVEWQRNLAVSTWRVADLLRMRGELGRSVELFADADRRMRTAIAKAPDRAWGTELAGIHITYARALAAANQRPRAEQMLVATLKRLEADRTPAARSRIADAWFYIGELQRAHGHSKEAVAAWTNAYAALGQVDVKSTDHRRISLKVRILARLRRLDELRPMRAHLRQIGYQDRDIEQICSDEGC